MRTLVLSLVCWIGLIAGAQAENRVALVIGNANYAHSTPLTNPLNDSAAVAAKLEAIGFDVSLHQNLGGQAFRMALGQFTEKALGADLALVFYAGHGIEMSGSNYMIPIDAEMRSEATAVYEAVNLEEMLRPVRQAGKLGMIMIDACRDNPFASTMKRNNGTRSLSRGLAPVSLDGESGLIVSFAAEAGSTADDGDTNHSPYTEALLKVLDQPGLEVGRMFRKVRGEVRQATNGRQVPIERMQLPDQEIFLVALPASTPPAVATAAQPVTQTPAPQPLVEDPLLAFINAAQSGSKVALETFVSRYPDHPKAEDARKLLLDMADGEFWQRTVTTDSEDAYRTYLIVFPTGRFASQAKQKIASFNQPAEVPVPVTPAPAPQATASPGALSCNELWYQRNAIYDAYGYCFKSARGKSTFDNSNCHTTSPSLSRADMSRVNALKAEEGRKGC